MIKKELFVGILVGLIANVIGLILAAIILGYFSGNGDDFTTVISTANREGFLGKLISIGAILNLIAFFIFIRKRKDYRARGVLLVTVLIAVFTFIIKIF